MELRNAFCKIFSLAISLVYLQRALIRDIQTASFAIPPSSLRSPGLSASASVIIYNCELPARLVLITSHGYGLHTYVNY